MFACDPQRFWTDISIYRRKITRLVAGEGDGTDKQTKSIAEQRSVLSTKLRSWCLIRPIYMPGLVRTLEEMEEGLRGQVTLHCDVAYISAEALMLLGSKASHEV